MKKILKFLAMGLVAVPLALASCSDDKTEPNPGPGPNPNPDPTPDPGITVIENDFAPIEVCNGDYEADPKTGVSVKILKRELKNIIFEVNPGENIKSYKFDIYPLASIYSTLQNNSLDPQTGAATKDKFTKEETREVIYNLLDRGMTGDQRDLLITPEKVADFTSAEFDWANSPYYYVHLVPDAAYLLVVQGYYDEAGKEPSEDMTVCYVRTETQELIGNPVLECEPIEGFFGVKTIHYLNEDAPYFYYFAGPQEGRGGCQFYYDTFGERMFIDFIRHTTIGGPARRDGDETNAFWQMEAPSGTKIFWAGIPLDANEVPNIDAFIMHTLVVKEVIDDAPVAEVECSVSEEHVGADSFWVDYKVNAGCARFHYNVITAEDAKQIETMTEQELENLKRALINNSWVCPNPNYKYNSKENQLLGTGYEGTVIDWDCRFDRVQTIKDLSAFRAGKNMELGIDYVVIGVGVNPYLQGGNLSVSKPFQLKVFNKTEPEKCETKIELDLTLLNRDGLNFKFTYDYGKCSQIYFGWVGGEDSYGKFEDATREQWLALLLDKRYSGEAGPNAIPWANIWAGDQASGTDGTGIAGLEQNHKYGVVYCATDLNGVVSELKYAELFIPEVVGGPNPVTEITWEAVAGAENTYNLYFKSNEDMVTVNYGIFPVSMQGANTGLADIKTGFYSYEDYIKMWTELAAGELPLKAQSLLISRGDEVLKENTVILALPYGRDPETKDEVTGELSYLLYIDGEFHKLEEYAEHEK